MKKVPFVTLDKLQEITAQFPTPFHLYDGNSKSISDPDPSGVWLWL